MTQEHQEAREDHEERSRGELRQPWGLLGRAGEQANLSRGRLEVRPLQGAGNPRASRVPVAPPHWSTALSWAHLVAPLASLDFRNAR